MTLKYIGYKNSITRRILQCEYIHFCIYHQYCLYIRYIYYVVVWIDLDSDSIHQSISHQDYNLNLRYEIKYSITSRYECPIVRLIWDTSRGASEVLFWNTSSDWDTRNSRLHTTHQVSRDSCVSNYPTHTSNVLVYLADEGSLISFSGALCFLRI